MTIAWSVPIPHASKIVLLALADNANDEGDCWPSITTLSRKCGMDRRTVMRVIEVLEQQRHLTRSITPGRTNSYRIHPCLKVTSDAKPLVADDHHTRGTAPPPLVAQRHHTSGGAPPRTIIEPSIEPSREPSTRARGAAQEVFDHWKATWGHPGALFDPKRRKRIEARLAHFTAEQLCQAISGFRNSPWHCGTDPKGSGTVYDGIETLLRDTEQVEKGIRLFAHPPRPPPKAETATERLLRLNSPDDSRVIDHEPEDIPAIANW